MSLTIIKTILIIVIISLITAQVTLTIIKAQKQRRLATNQEENSNVTYVASKKIDANRNEELDENGNAIDDDTRRVPVPKGYTASQVPGERSIDTGFVIYEGEINWSDYIVDETATISEYRMQEVNNNEDEANSNENQANNNVLQEEIEDNANLLQSEITNTVVQEPNMQEMVKNNEVQNNINEIEKTETLTKENNEIINEKNTEEKQQQEKINNEQLENENKEEIQKDEITKINTENLQTTSMEISTYANEITQTDINIFNLQKSVNQYVWVPISEYELEEIYGVDSNGKLWGKLYSSYNPTTIHSRQGINWKLLEDGTMSIMDPIGAREPDVTRSNNYSIDRQLPTNLEGQTRYELLSKELEQDFYKTIESIKKYGGFYIGRYETGGSGVTQKMKNDSSTSWYSLYPKCKILKGEKSNVRTSMIWGSLWDATLRWFIASGETASNGVKIDNTYLTNYNYAKYLGNYYYATFDYIKIGAIEPLFDQRKEVNTFVRVATGGTEHTKINNIYDMAGNMQEWTMEVAGAEMGIFRGFNFSCYYYVPYNECSHPGMRLDDVQPKGNLDTLTRSILYIQ